MELEIIQLGNPVLFQVAKEVSNPSSPEVRKLVGDMFETLSLAIPKGVGLAAPQVNESLRIFVMSTMNSSRPDIKKIELEFINPVITKASEQLIDGWETCLSVTAEERKMGIAGLVPRHEWIEVAYFTLGNEMKSQRFEGFVARVIQHEIDHLNGLLFIDRVRSTKDIVSGKYYAEVIIQSKLK